MGAEQTTIETCEDCGTTWNGTDAENCPECRRTVAAWFAAREADFQAQCRHQFRPSMIQFDEFV